MSLYEAIAQTRGGRSHLAKARLRYRVLSLLHDALSRSGLNQSELAEQAEVSKSAVSQTFAGNGNLRIDTIAAYLDALGFELGLSLEKAGTARAKATDWVSGPVIHAELTPAVATRPLLEASAFGPTESFCFSVSTANPALVEVAR
jgi:transcriptional regulator with XRE-family HTH domain